MARSLGWCVPTNWIARDFIIRSKIPNEVESLANDHLLVHFKFEERDAVLYGGP